MDTCIGGSKVMLICGGGLGHKDTLPKRLKVPPVWLCVAVCMCVYEWCLDRQ